MDGSIGVHSSCSRWVRKGWYANLDFAFPSVYHVEDLITQSLLLVLNVLIRCFLCSSRDL